MQTSILINQPHEIAPNGTQEDEIARLKAQVSQYKSWFRAIDEHSKFDFWFKDANSNYTYANPYFAKNMGRHKCQLEETPINELFQGDRYERIRNLDLQVMADEYLNRVIPCDASGTLEMHEEHRFAVKDEDGTAIGLGCFAFVITEKSLAEETLDQAEKLAKLCSWRWSAETNALMSCSEQTADFLGVSITQAFALFPKRFDKLVIPEDRHVFKTIEDRMNGKSAKSYEIEYRMRGKDGSIIHVRETAEPFSASNNAAEYLGVMQDITEQKAAETALRLANENLESKVQIRTAELETAKNIAVQSNEAKNLFLASMSHELRTPLNAIIGFSDLMVKQTKNPLDDADYADISQHILNSGKDLLRMIEDVLVVANTKEHSNETLDFEELDLTPLINTAIDSIKHECKSKNVNLIWTEPKQEYTLQGNAQKLTRILQAILSNAVRFNKENGRVHIRLNPAPETTATKGVFIDIADTGIGIAEDDLKRIMLPFVQADNSFTRSYDGAGLGLSIAKRWVELHGGKLSIASRLGEGTLVRIFLPASVKSKAKNTQKRRQYAASALPHSPPHL